MGLLFHLRTEDQPEPSPERRRLLDSALRTFAARGYDRASLKQIATEASVTAAMVNYYFGSKEKLFAHVIDACYRRLGAIVEQRAHASLSFEERLRGFVNAHVEFCKAAPAEAELLVRTAFRLDDALGPESAERYEPLRELAHEIFTVAVSHGELTLRRSLDARRAAEWLLGQVELTVIRLVQDRRVPGAGVPSFTTEETVDLFLRGVDATRAR